ncbi:uncharacterized protein LOC112012173 [Quercus suber]|uniref:uncharacterized protein LOC112012173 n=1 Tax=Quercus suber TaxID=58331 RepID=UPI000CE1BB48|nr:uncharacterized protein LOC111993525 [Quercus suber]POF22888.1 hypothetical protein CFP56_38175 [Quercus suber]
MSRTGSGLSCKLRSILETLHRDRSCSGYISQGHRPVFSVNKLGNGYGMNEGSKFFSINSKTWKKHDANTVNQEKGKVQPPAPTPPKFNLPSWAKWILGSSFAFSLPLWNWKQDWRTPQRIEGEAEIVAKEVEIVAEVVEKVGTAAEKVSAKAADKLPENGNLKKAALLVERISKEVVHDAQLTEDFIHKVDTLKEDVETLVEPVIDHIAKQESKAK